VAITYSVVSGYKLLIHRFSGAIYFEGMTEFVPVLSYPFWWLVFPLLLAGICLLVARIILRAYSERVLF